MEQILVSQLSSLSQSSFRLQLRSNAKKTAYYRRELGDYLKSNHMIVDILEKEDNLLAGDKVQLISETIYSNNSRTVETIYTGGFNPIIFEYVLNHCKQKTLLGNYDTLPDGFFKFKIEPIIHIESAVNLKKNKKKVDKAIKKEDNQEEEHEGMTKRRSPKSSRNVHRSRKNEDDHSIQSINHEYHGRKCYCCSNRSEEESQIQDQFSVFSKVAKNSVFANKQNGSKKQTRVSDFHPLNKKISPQPLAHHLSVRGNSSQSDRNQQSSSVYFRKQLKTLVNKQGEENNKVQKVPIKDNNRVGQAESISEVQSNKWIRTKRNEQPLIKTNIKQDDKLTYLKRGNKISTNAPKRNEQLLHNAVQKKSANKDFSQQESINEHSIDSKQMRSNKKGNQTVKNSTNNTKLEIEQRYSQMVAHNDHNLEGLGGQSVDQKNPKNICPGLQKMAHNRKEPVESSFRNKKDLHPITRSKPKEDSTSNQQMPIAVSLPKEKMTSTNSKTFPEGSITSNVDQSLHKNNQNSASSHRLASNRIKKIPLTQKMQMIKQGQQRVKTNKKQNSNPKEATQNIKNEKNIENPPQQTRQKKSRGSSNRMQASPSLQQKGGKQQNGKTDASKTEKVNQVGQKKADQVDSKMESSISTKNKNERLSQEHDDDNFSVTQQRISRNSNHQSNENFIEMKQSSKKPSNSQLASHPKPQNDLASTIKEINYQDENSRQVTQTHEEGLQQQTQGFKVQTCRTIPIRNQSTDGTSKRQQNQVVNNQSNMQQWQQEEEKGLQNFNKKQGPEYFDSLFESNNGEDEPKTAKMEQQQQKEPLTQTKNRNQEKSQFSDILETPSNKIYEASNLPHPIVSSAGILNDSQPLINQEAVRSQLYSQSHNSQFSSTTPLKVKQDEPASKSRLSIDGHLLSPHTGRNSTLKTDQQIQKAPTDKKEVESQPQVQMPEENLQEFQNEMYDNPTQISKGSLKEVREDQKSNKGNKDFLRLETIDEVNESIYRQNEKKQFQEKLNSISISSSISSSKLKENPSCATSKIASEVPTSKDLPQVPIINPKIEPQEVSVKQNSSIIPQQNHPTVGKEHSQLPIQSKNSQQQKIIQKSQQTKEQNIQNVHPAEHLNNQINQQQSYSHEKSQHSQTNSEKIHKAQTKPNDNDKSMAPIAASPQQNQKQPRLFTDGEKQEQKEGFYLEEETPLNSQQAKLSLAQKVEESSSRNQQSKSIQNIQSNKEMVSSKDLKQKEQKVTQSVKTINQSQKVLSGSISQQKQQQISQQNTFMPSSSYSKLPNPRAEQQIALLPKIEETTAKLDGSAKQVQNKSNQNIISEKSNEQSFSKANEKDGKQQQLHNQQFKQQSLRSQILPNQNKIVSIHQNSKIEMKEEKDKSQIAAQEKNNSDIVSQDGTKSKILPEDGQIIKSKQNQSSEQVNEVQPAIIQNTANNKEVKEDALLNQQSTSKKELSQKGNSEVHNNVINEDKTVTKGQNSMVHQDHTRQNEAKTNHNDGKILATTFIEKKEQIVIPQSKNQTQNIEQQSFVKQPSPILNQQPTNSQKLETMVPQQKEIPKKQPQLLQRKPQQQAKTQSQQQSKVSKSLQPEKTVNLKENDEQRMSQAKFQQQNSPILNKQNENQLTQQQDAKNKINTQQNGLVSNRSPNDQSSSNVKTQNKVQSANKETSTINMDQKLSQKLNYEQYPSKAPTPEKLNLPAPQQSSIEVQTDYILTSEEETRADQPYYKSHSDHLSKRKRKINLCEPEIINNQFSCKQLALTSKEITLNNEAPFSRQAPFMCRETALVKQQFKKKNRTEALCMKTNEEEVKKQFDQDGFSSKQYQKQQQNNSTRLMAARPSNVQPAQKQKREAKRSTLSNILDFQHPEDYPVSSQDPLASKEPYKQILEKDIKGQGGSGKYREKTHPEIINRLIYKNIPIVRAPVLTQDRLGDRDKKEEIIRNCISFMERFLPGFIQSLSNKQKTEVSLFLNNQWMLFQGDFPLDLKDILLSELRELSVYKCLEAVTGMPMRILKDKEHDPTNKRLIKSLKTLLERKEEEKGFETVMYGLHRSSIQIVCLDKIRYFLDGNKQSRPIFECRKMGAKGEEVCNFEGETVSQFTQLFLLSSPRYLTLEVDPSALNTYELQLSNLVFYASGNYKFLLYEQTARNEYKLAKESHLWLKHRVVGDGRFLLILEPIPKREGQHVITLRLATSDQGSGTNRIVKYHNGGRAKGYQGGYQNQKNLYIPVFKQINQE